MQYLKKKNQQNTLFISFLSDTFSFSFYFIRNDVPLDGRFVFRIFLVPPPSQTLLRGGGERFPIHLTIITNAKTTTTFGHYNDTTPKLTHLSALVQKFKFDWGWGGRGEQDF